MTATFKLNEKTSTYTVKDRMTRDDIVRFAKELVSERLLASAISLSSPADTRDFLMLHMAELEHEVFACLFLDTRHRVISYQELFQGTIDGSSVHPREVVKAALKLNAAAVIFAHNHPSGVAEPSTADERITRRLKDALALVEVRVLDHVIVGSNETTSFAERGLI